jgi:RimJ/RimL family protein N-acetyltransferase
MKILETDRLILSEQSTSDAAFILELMNSPGWLKYIGDRNVHTTEEAATYIINGAMKSYKENGFGLYLVTTKSDQSPIGICGLIKRPGLEATDIGFAFLPQHEGKGYGYESASAVMAHARTELGLGAIVAITVAENEPSIKLLKKIGLSFAKTITLPGSEEELMLFESRISSPAG